MCLLFSESGFRCRLGCRHNAPLIPVSFERKEAQRRGKSGKLRRRVGILGEAAGLQDMPREPGMSRSGRLQLSDGRRHLEKVRRSLDQGNLNALNGCSATSLSGGLMGLVCTGEERKKRSQKAGAGLRKNIIFFQC